MDVKISTYVALGHCYPVHEDSPPTDHGQYHRAQQSLESVP